MEPSDTALIPALFLQHSGVAEHSRSGMSRLLFAQSLGKVLLEKLIEVERKFLPEFRVKPVLRKQGSQALTKDAKKAGGRHGSGSFKEQPYGGG
jgi:hypothetical protein